MMMLAVSYRETLALNLPSIARSSARQLARMTHLSVLSLSSGPGTSASLLRRQMYSRARPHSHPCCCGTRRRPRRAAEESRRLQPGKEVAVRATKLDPAAQLVGCRRVERPRRADTTQHRARVVHERAHEALTEPMNELHLQGSVTTDQSAEDAPARSACAAGPRCERRSKRLAR